MSVRTDLDVIIIGAGGHGKEICSHIRALATHGENVRAIGFVDENKAKGAFGDSEILGGFADLKAFLDRCGNRLIHYITAVGDNATRMTLVKKIDSVGRKNLLPWTLLSARTTIGQDVAIGEGSCLAPGSIITTHVRIGKHCILNVHASVSHDCIVGDFVNINPGAVVCGDVSLGDGSYIGAGAVIKDKVIIGRGVTVGAGAVVIGDLPDGVTAVGVPARIIKQTSMA